MSVDVVPFCPVDHDLLEPVLGVPSLQIETSTAASHWLLRNHQGRPVMDTNVAHARGLAAWIE